MKVRVKTMSKSLLHAREDFAQPSTENESADAMEGWEAALLAVKETAEKNHGGKG